MFNHSPGIIKDVLKRIIALTAPGSPVMKYHYVETGTAEYLGQVKVAFVSGEAMEK